MAGSEHTSGRSREELAVGAKLRELARGGPPPAHHPPTTVAVESSSPAATTAHVQPPIAATKTPRPRPRARAATAKESARHSGLRPPPRPGIGRRLLSSLKWIFLIKPKVLIIERYLWKETFGHFMLGAMGFTFFMVITTIFALGEKIFTKNIPPFTVAKILMLSAPGFLVLAVPVAVVFSTLMAMGRLNRDQEIIAMQTNGISLYRIFIPFLTMATMAGILSWLLYEKVVPPNAAQQVEVLKVFWYAQVTDFIKPGIVISAPQKKYFYVDEITKVKDDTGAERSLMKNIRLYDYYTEQHSGLRPYPRVFIAKEAWVEDQFLVLSDVTLYNLDERSGSNLVSASMSKVEIDIATKIVEFQLDPQPKELSWRDLRNRVHRLRDSLNSSGFLRTDIQAQLNLNWTEYYMKFSIPFACISFVLVAIPVSLRGPRDERNLGIILTFLLVMAYYIIFFTAQTLGSRGVILPEGAVLFGHKFLRDGTNLLPPYVAGWLAPGLFVLASIPMWIKARK